jgi:hypothetical protein
MTSDAASVDDLREKWCVVFFFFPSFFSLVCAKSVEFPKTFLHLEVVRDSKEHILKVHVSSASSLNLTICILFFIFVLVFCNHFFSNKREETFG